MNQLLRNIDIILSNFSFSKLIEILEPCISIVSLRHQRASITDLNTEHGDDVSKLLG